MNDISIEDICVPKVGQLWKHESGEVFVVARFNANNCALISLQTGNRWDDPTKLENLLKGDESWFSLLKTGNRVTLEVE